MFSDNNNNELKQIPQPSKQIRNEPRYSPNNDIPIAKEEVNYKEKREKDVQWQCNEKEQKRQGQTKSSRKINRVGCGFEQRRKLSGEYMKNRDKIENDGEFCHKSDRAQIDSSEDHHRILVDESSKKSQGCNYGIQQIEGSLWKKIRNLETRLKNINLNYNTLLIKTKCENVKLEKENKYYLKFIQEHCPKLLEQFNAYISKYLKQEEEMFYDSNSNSSEQDKHDQWMPIMSKMQQIRMDVTKIFQSIKNYQGIIKKYESEKEEYKRKQLQGKKQRNQLIHPLSIERKEMIRKFSIPNNLLKSTTERIQQMNEDYMMRFQERKTRKQNKFVVQQDDIKLAEELTK